MQNLFKNNKIIIFIQHFGILALISSHRQCEDGIKHKLLFILVIWGVVIYTESLTLILEQF